MSTVTPPRVPQEPQPPGGGGDPGRETWVDLAKWCLSDHRRAAWVMAFVVVILCTFAFAVWMLAPHVGALLAAVGGFSVSALVAAIVEAIRRWWDGRGDDGGGTAT